MRKNLCVFALSISAMVQIYGTNAFANDGGVAAIKVNDIRMREYKDASMKDELRRITSPHFKISFKGGEAAKLQKVLPPTVSVITAMQPEIKEQYNETFRNLAIYNEKTAQVSEKLISISCDDGELVSAGSDGKMKIVKKAETECTITISKGGADDLGDIQKFEPVCK